MFNHDDFKSNFSDKRSKDNISTSFESNLEAGILDLLNKYKDTTLTEVTKQFGNYEKVHDKLKDLMLQNKILIYKSEIDQEQGIQKKIKLVDPSQSIWESFNAQPCLTCPIMSECKIGNPVSPATCEELQEWIEYEIELELRK